MALETYEVYFAIAFVLMWMAFLWPAPAPYTPPTNTQRRPAQRRAQSAHRASTAAAWFAWFTWPTWLTWPAWPAFLTATGNNNNRPIPRPSNPAQLTPPAPVDEQVQYYGQSSDKSANTVRKPVRSGSRALAANSLLGPRKPMPLPPTFAKIEELAERAAAESGWKPRTYASEQERAAVAAALEASTPSSTSVHRLGVSAFTQSRSYQLPASVISQFDADPSARLSTDGSLISLRPAHLRPQRPPGPVIALDTPPASPSSSSASPATVAQPPRSKGAGFLAPTDPNDDSNPKTYSEMVARPAKSQGEFQTYHSENDIPPPMSWHERIIADDAYEVLRRTQKENIGMSDSHAYPKDDRTWAIQYLTNAMKGERKRAEHLRAADIYPDQDIIKAHNAAVSQLPPPPDASENAFDITSPPPGHHLAEWLKHASNPDEPRNVPLASPLAEQSQAEDDRRFTRETPPPEDMWDGQVCRQAPKVLKRKDRDDDSAVDEAARPTKKVRFMVNGIDDGKWVDRHGLMLPWGSHERPDPEDPEYLRLAASRHVAARRPHPSNPPRALEDLRAHTNENERTPEELLQSVLTYRHFDLRRRVIELMAEALENIGMLPEHPGNPAFIVGNYLPQSDEVPVDVDRLQDDNESCDADGLSTIAELCDPDFLEGLFAWLGPERADRRQLRAGFWRPAFYTEFKRLLLRFSAQHGTDAQLSDELRKLPREFWIHQSGARPSVNTQWSMEGLPGIPTAPPDYVAAETLLREPEMEAEDPTDGLLDLDNALRPLRTFLEGELDDFGRHPRERRAVIEKWAILWHDEYKPQFLHELSALDSIDQYELTGYKEDRIHYGALRRAAREHRMEEHASANVEDELPVEHHTAVDALVTEDNAEDLALGLAMAYRQQHPIPSVSPPAFAIATSTSTTTANAAVREAAAVFSSPGSPASPPQAAQEDTDSVDALLLSPAASSACDAVAGTGPVTRASAPLGERVNEDTVQSGVRASRPMFMSPSPVALTLPARARSPSPCRPSVTVPSSVLGRRPRSDSDSPAPARPFKRRRLGTPFPEREAIPPSMIASTSALSNSDAAPQHIQPAQPTAPTAGDDSAAHIQPAGSPPAKTATAPTRRRRAVAAPVEPSRRSDRQASRTAAATLTAQALPTRRTRSSRSSSVASSANTAAGPSTTPSPKATSTTKGGRKRKA